MADFKRVNYPGDPYEIADHHPWDMFCEPFRVAPCVWYVSGNDWVASYLIETEAGLILIDCSDMPVLYQLTESIRLAGFNPRDIKLILLSHAHVDHCGGLRSLKEYTGAKVYMSQEDAQIWAQHPDRVYFDRACIPCEADDFYDDNKKIQLGGVEIQTKLTPGHTVGTTSFFFTVSDGNERYRCAMHGGLGLNTLDSKSLEQMGYPLSLRERFIKDCRELAEYDVDICLASHTNQMNYLSAVNMNDRSDYRDFIDRDAWKNMMLERAEAAAALR